MVIDNGYEEWCHKTVTNNKKAASEETRRFLKEETSLSLEYELYDFVLDRIKRIQNKYKITV